MARILVIDDDNEILILIKNTLQKDGHEIICRQGITNDIKERIPQCDLILLDVMMPGTDGLTFARQIKSNRHLMPIHCLL